MDSKYFYNCIGEIKKIFDSKVSHRMLKEVQTRFDNKMNNEIIFQNLKLTEKFIRNSKLILDFGFGGGYMDALIRKLNEKASIFALDTIVHDDIDDNRENTQGYIKELEKILNILSKKYNIEYNYYDGKHLPYQDNQFDLIFSYAVLEHISPENRPVILNELYRILKNGGYLLILRLPRNLSLAEFMARKLKLGSHQWPLSKRDLIELINNKFKIELIKKIDSTFCNPIKITNAFYPVLKSLDSFFTWTQLNFWAHDYSIVLKKIVII